jgi:hypothetical protein
MTTTMKIRRRGHRAEITNPEPKWCEAQRNWMVSDYRLGTRKRIRFKTLEKASDHCQIIRSHYQNEQKIIGAGFNLNPGLGVAWGFLDELLQTHYNTDILHVVQDYMNGQDAAVLTTPRGRHVLQMMAAYSALTPQK